MYVVRWLAGLICSFIIWMFLVRILLLLQSLLVWKPYRRRCRCINSKPEVICFAGIPKHQDMVEFALENVSIKFKHLSTNTNISTEYLSRHEYTPSTQTHTMWYLPIWISHFSLSSFGLHIFIYSLHAINSFIFLFCISLCVCFGFFLFP